MMRVAIVGGGLAGLTCAFALKQRGISATVFEAADRPGGRLPAACYLLGREQFAHTFRLIESLDLHRDLIEIPPIAGQYYKGHVYHHRVFSVSGLLGFKGLHIADKAMLSRMAYFLLRYGAKLDFHHPERGAAFDDETTAAFVKRELSQNILNYVAGPLISTLFYYSSEETSKVLYLNLAKYMYTIRMETIRGGLERIASRLLERVNVRHNYPVRSIRPADLGYEITGEKWSHVVIAVPGNDVLAIDGVRDLLSAEDIDFFEKCRYGRAVGVTVTLDKALESCYALSIPRVEKLKAATVMFHDFIDPSTVDGGRRATIMGGGDDVQGEQLLDDFERIYRVRPNEWKAAEWKTAMPKFPPGRYRQLAEFLSRSRRPGLLFCGDYLMGPFLEASVTTAQRAADVISHCSGGL
jgi:protoporphyrinogen oxidase